MTHERRLALATVGFLDAAYAWVRTDEEWLAGVIGGLREVWGPAQWIYGLFYDASDVRRFKILSVQEQDVPSKFQAVIKPLTESYPPEIVASVYRAQCLGFGSSLGMQNSPVADAVKEAGIADIFGLNAIDPEGLGCSICIGTKKTRLEPLEIALFQRLTIHLASAYRCRRRLHASGQTPPEGAEIILDADGRVLDATGPGRAASARQAVTLTARAVQEARGGDSDPSLRWLPRVRTRWTLLDAVSPEGDPLVIARENQAATRALDSLTDRERQVVASAAYGRSNKEIAYDLGIATSTARVLLARAYARLGVGSRDELLELPAIRAMRGEAIEPPTTG